MRRLIELARRPPSWLRIAFAGLVLVFVFSSTAHITHQHEAIPGIAVHTACGYCLSFDGLADVRLHRAFAPGAKATDDYVFAPAPTILCFASPCAAQPRAPPIS